MTGIRAHAPSPAPKTAPPPESKWMLERGGVSDRLEAEGIRGEAEAKQPRGAGVSEISEAVHGDPLADGSIQPRFQVSPEQQGGCTSTQEKTSPDDQIPHRKAGVFLGEARESIMSVTSSAKVQIGQEADPKSSYQPVQFTGSLDTFKNVITGAHADGSPSLAAEQVEIHVGNKVTRHDIPEGEISMETYVELPENEQIRIERSATMETNSQANTILESSAIDDIIEPQMADYFDFMGDYGLDPATDASSEKAEHSPVQLEKRITMVKELLATGLFENEEIVYSQKSGQRKKLRGKIDGVFYRCSCHNEVMSASKFEKHAGCTSRNQNDRIMLWGERSLHGIVAYLKSLGTNEDQLAAILEMKKKNENRKAPRDEG